MRIGEIAEQTCVSKSTIRYYESIHLIPPPRRSESGYRCYTDADAQRIRLVVGARLVGFSVADIRQVIRMQDEGCCPETRLLELLEAKVREVRKRMSYLEDIKEDLVKLHALGLELEAQSVKRENGHNGSKAK